MGEGGGIVQPVVSARAVAWVVIVGLKHLYHYFTPLLNRAAEPSFLWRLRLQVSSFLAAPATATVHINA